MHSCRAPARVHALLPLPCMVQMPVCAVCTHGSECVRSALCTSLSLFLLPPTARQITTKQEWEASRVPLPQVTPDEPIPWKAQLAAAAAVWQHKLIPASDSGKVSGHFRDKIGTFLLLAWVEVKCHRLTSA